MKTQRILATFAGLAFLVIASAAQGQTSPASEPVAAQWLKPGDRIVFIGDSITGLGERNQAGFVHLMRKALAAAHKDSSFELVGLGASGWSVMAWESKLAQKRTAKDEWFTDVPNVGVNATLDKKADVIVIMLGINDAFLPLVGEQASPYMISLDEWEKHYLKLIEIIRARTHARVVALAQATPVGENLALPGNLFVDKLNARVAVIARKADCVVLPTNDACKRMIREGRRIQSDFQITYDHVHPNDDGHLAIAMGMLAGLGEAGAIQTLEELVLLRMRGRMRKNLSIAYELTPLEARGDEQEFRVRYWWPRPGSAVGMALAKVTIRLPEGWTATPRESRGDAGEFRVSGKCDRLKNVLVLEGAAGEDKRRVEIAIPAPWLLAGGPVHPWSRLVPMVEKDVRTLIDEAIEQGKDFTAAIDLGKISDPQFKRQTLQWKRYFATIDNFGGPSPLIADFYGVTNGKAFQTGYGARWVYSDRDRPIRLELFCPPKVDGIYLFAWLNGKKEYSGQLALAPDRRVSIKTNLKKGWNALAFRCCRWMAFGVGIELLPVGQDDLKDLRYSVAPK